MSQNEIEVQAKSASTSMITLVILQLLAQIFLKGSMDELWSLFFTLQIISYLNVYGAPIPANSELYLRELTSLVEFDIVNPEKLLARFGVHFSFSELLFGIRKKANITLNKF